MDAKMNKQLYITLSILTFLVLTLSPASAITTYQESTSLGRIVGDTPTDLIRQMRGESLTVYDATAYPANTFSNPSNILETEFGASNVNSVGSDYSNFVDFQRIETAITQIKDNELIVIDTQGNTNPLQLQIGSDYINEKLSTDEISTWEDELREMIIKQDHEGVLQVSNVLAQMKEFDPNKFDSFILKLKNQGEVRENVHKLSNLLYLNRNIDLDNIDTNALNNIMDGSNKIIKSLGVELK
jgi:hypothetical protein